MALHFWSSSYIMSGMEGNQDYRLLWHADSPPTFVYHTMIVPMGANPSMDSFYLLFKFSPGSWWRQNVSEHSHNVSMHACYQVPVNHSVVIYHYTKAGFVMTSYCVHCIESTEHRMQCFMHNNTCACVNCIADVVMLGIVFIYWYQSGGVMLCWFTLFLIVSVLGWEILFAFIIKWVKSACTSMHDVCYW